MMRCVGAMFVIVLLLGLGSCPVPVGSLAGQGDDEAATGLDPELTAAMAPDQHGEAAGSAAPEPNTPAPGAVGPVAPDLAQAAVDQGLQPAPQPGEPLADGQSPGGQTPVGPQAPATAPQPQGQPDAASPVGPAAPPQQAPQYGALDAENFMGDAPPDSVWGQPKPKLGEDALRIAGRWLVAVIHRQGDARMLEDNAEWVLDLGRDGSFFAKQDRGGQTWRQSGTWELSGMKLLLHSGPGGERGYELSQEMDNICVLRDPGRETALFCVRERDTGNSITVQAKYDTDFGLLNLRPAGPGHWRGSYGEPAGVLLLAQLGSYLVGSWEQAPSKGFVLLELREGGFAGAWLYDSSVYFDGRWVGVASQ